MTIDYWSGVRAQERGDPCPQEASNDFQRGYGESYAAQEARPPIDLRKVNESFNRIFGEIA